MLTFFFARQKNTSLSTYWLMMFSKLTLVALAAILAIVSPTVLFAQDSGGFSNSVSPSNPGNYGDTGGGNSGQSGGFVVSSTYKIKPLDELTVRLFVADDLQFAHQVRVGGDGTVSLPYLGQVDVEGMTIDEIRQHIYKPYNEDYYVNPQIDLKVVSYASRVVTVIGKVNRQGKVPFPSEEPMYLIEAIAQAGGWSNDRMADQKNVTIYRKDDNGNTTEIVVDARQLTARDYPLKDGDVVEVPEKVW
ncbi:MAG: polysaccharide export outer membrane protein [Puniceicoccaceae bacterium 5H]|nr:MAG: polysaccharide export outer membrane protein [Puniceicoccaceae bacterium 5H]